MKKSIILSTIPLLFLGAAMAHAQSSQTAFQLSLTPDTALYPRTTRVEGFSLGLWSENPQMSFTLGVVNGSTGDSGGFSCAVVNYDESYHGFQCGLVNLSSQEFIGLQEGAVNIADGTVEGCQSGAVNIAQTTTGLQLGVFNYAENLRGVQLGVVNIARNNPWFSEFPDKLATGFPFLNWSF
jgi:hypothetical protein